VTAARFLSILCVLALVAPASAQVTHSQQLPNGLPAGSEVLFTVDRLIKLSPIFLALGLVGWAVLKLWSKARQTNDPLKLALADPWMRAKLEAMSEQERAAFFGPKG
jgi:hypothetical protein